MAPSHGAPAWCRMAGGADDAIQRPSPAAQRAEARARTHEPSVMQRKPPPAASAQVQEIELMSSEPVQGQVRGLPKEMPHDHGIAADQGPL